MRICGLIQDSIVDGPGLRFVCFVQGCPHRCPGCHNPSSHDPGGGQELPVEEIARQLLSNPLTDGLTLSGGEPFAQPEPCLQLAQLAHAHRLTVWTYTGYTLDHLLAQGTSAQLALLRETDVLVDGPFLQSQRTLSLPFRGSANQRLIQVPATLQSGTTVLWEEKC
ncbi:MAG: anaerobic ribonucleoside-triphosphate reductase activating protein [Oscillospiraceae bacterium]|jgi:anaerobic ribonucleoside-triphosphate reductase activating protein|nr:anaerobic ribonucleoside-triphosphate reductase activating protein [Oscillospiraceae bacterium]